MHFGLVRRQAGEHAAQPLRVFAERRAHPVVAGGRRVALVENQVDDFEHRGEPHVELGPARHFVGDLLVGQRALGADDALLDGGLGGQKRARDLFGREAGQQLQRQRHARLGRQHRVARREDQPQQVIAHIVIQRRVEIRRGVLLARLHLVADLLVLVIDQLVAAEVIDAAALGDRHQPRAGIARDAFGRPLLERRDQRILREIFGEADVARHARQRGDQLRRLDLPDRVDRRCVSRFQGSMVPIVPRATFCWVTSVPNRNPTEPTIWNLWNSGTSGTLELLSS